MNEIAKRLQELYPETLLADGLDDALIGYTLHQPGRPVLAVYSMSRAVWVLRKDGISVEEAIEYLEFNTIGAWMGPHTPIWIDDLVTDEEYEEETP